MLKRKYFIFSIIGHLLIVASALIYFEYTKNSLKNFQTISSYVYSIASKSSLATESESHPPASKNNFSTLRDKSLLLKKSTQKKLTRQEHSIGSHEHINQEKNNAIKVNQDQPILQLLHNAIAAKQTYPEIAIELKQSGIVKVGFNLAPNGVLSNISIIRSSGFQSLDEAAIRAVNAISPLQIPANYLKLQQAYFTVDVIFG